MASIGVSEMLGNPIKLSGATRSAPSASSPATFETVALFGKKKAAPPPPSKKAAAAVTPANDELAKWYGPDRRIFLPKGLLDRSKILPYLTGEVPGDKKPEDIAKYVLTLFVKLDIYPFGHISLRTALKYIYYLKYTS
nr:chlorophyll a-b binding protein CP26, chloroplastic-like [Arachis hypogaea]